jgi:hypothetical protein
MRKTAFIIAGGLALLYAAGLIAEQWPVPLAIFGQCVGPLLIFLGSVTFVVRARVSAEIPGYSLAFAGATLSGLWLAFIAYYYLTFDLSAMG